MAGDAARRARVAGLALALAAIAGASAPAHALRVVTWNLHTYPSDLPTRQPALRTAVAALQPDLIAVQELMSQAGRDSLLLNVLNVVEPGQWAASSYNATTESAVFYRTSKLSLNFTSLVATAGPRDVLLCRLRPVGYATSASDFRVYSVHFKAGDPATSPADSTTRRLECTDLRNTLNLAPAGTQFLVGGDTNFYGSWEGGYARLTETQADNDGRSLDPNPLSGTWNSFTFRYHHSQSPCLSGCLSGYSGGGLDDRFDFWMTSYNLQDGEGLDLVAGSAFPYGQDGQHYNDAVNGGGFNNAVGIAVANALQLASDHLPGVVVLQVPAKIAAASSLDFGTVITGATAEQTLAVGDAAVAPADELTYSFGAPADFTAPAGTFNVQAGAAPANHTLGMLTAAPGARSGTLTVACDDPDSAAKPVALSGLVLAHAVPSLHGLVQVVEDTLDFGAHGSGGFADLEVRVHDLGYGPLQARLAVNSGVLTGGAGRFAIVGGFQPALVAGTPAAYSVRFDDAGATADSTYEATLTFGTADEPLPGAMDAPALVVRLVAQPRGNVEVPGEPLPTAVRFAAPRPNPLAAATTLRFELPRATAIELVVFDAAGRRVARLDTGTRPAGRHEVRWDARDEQGQRVGAGLYFVRFRAGDFTETRRLVVLR